jgi:hypothetical protein
LEGEGEIFEQGPEQEPEQGPEQGLKSLLKGDALSGQGLAQTVYSLCRFAFFALLYFSILCLLQVCFILSLRIRDILLFFSSIYCHDVN